MTYETKKGLAANKQVAKKQPLSSSSAHFEEVRQILSQDNECYVLITCAKAGEDGKMQVEMSYEGDSDLAAYLIESAQDFIE